MYEARGSINIPSGISAVESRKAGQEKICAPYSLGLFALFRWRTRDDCCLVKIESGKRTERHESKQLPVLFIVRQRDASRGWLKPQRTEPCVFLPFPCCFFQKLVLWNVGWHETRQTQTASDTGLYPPADLFGNDADLVVTIVVGLANQKYHDRRFGFFVVGSCQRHQCLAYMTEQMSTSSIFGASSPYDICSFRPSTRMWRLSAAPSYQPSDTAHHGRAVMAIAYFLSK